MAKKPTRSSRIDRSSKEFQDRLEGFREARKQGQIERKETPKDYAKRAFGEFLLGSYGFGEEDFAAGGVVKGKLGLFAEAAKSQKKDSGGGGGATEVPPVMEAPAQEREKTNPEISTLIKQFESLIKTANKIGVITTAQQKELREQIRASSRNYKESQMEAEKATMETSTSSANFTPINTEFDKLFEKFKALQEAVDEKLKQQEKEKYAQRGFKQRLAEEYGFGEEYEEYTKKKQIRESRIKTKPDVVSKLDKSGKMRYYKPDPVTGNLKRIKDAEAIADAVPTRMQRMTGGVKNAGQGVLNAVKGMTTGARRTSARVRGASMATRGAGISSKISSLIGRGIKGAGVAASVTKGAMASTVKKIAGPIITKALGSTVLKSIPIVGALAGGLFAAKKLLEGDPVGAGLEATSGLAGPLTAIPAMVATVARDTYSSVFNVQPEQDPEFGPRMAMITSIVGGLVTAMLASKIESKPTPTKDQVAKIETPPKPPAKPEAKPSPTGGPPIKKAPAPEKPKSQPSPSGPKKSDEAKPKPTSSGASTSGTYDDRNGQATPEAAKQQTATPPPTTGAELAQKSAEVESMANQPIVLDITKQPTPLPSTSPPTKSGVSGAGDVPDPIYYGMGSLIFEIYFNSNPATTT